MIFLCLQQVEQQLTITVARLFCCRNCYPLFLSKSHNFLILDGTSWIMTLTYSDGRRREISGSNKWPETFNLFNTVITNAYYKATDKWPTGAEERKPDIKGGKYNDPSKNYLWKKVK